MWHLEEDGRKLKSILEKREKILGKKDRIEQSEINLMSECSLNPGGRKMK